MGYNIKFNIHLILNFVRFSMTHVIILVVATTAYKGFIFLCYPFPLWGPLTRVFIASKVIKIIQFTKYI